MATHSPALPAGMSPGANDAIDVMNGSLSPSSSRSTSSSSMDRSTVSDSLCSPLADLPEELLSNISFRLGSDDLFNLRLTCRSVEAKTFHKFATEYFSAKGFMFTTDSLKVLVNIAKHPKLKEFLKEIYFITANFPDRSLNCAHAKCCCWKPTTRQREAFIIYMRDQESLKKTAQDKTIISSAFSRLPAVRRLSIVDHVGGIPSRAELRGLQKFTRTTANRPSFAPPADIDPALLKEYYAWLSHVFRTVMLSVAASGKDTITKLETRFRCNADGLSPSHDLRYKGSTRKSLGKALANLTQLRLQLRTKNLREGESDGPNEMTRAYETLGMFGVVARNAQSLKISLDGGTTSGRMCASLMIDMQVSNLTKLFMHSTKTSTRALVKLVSKMQSMQKLSFDYVNLKGTAGWVPVLKALRELETLEHLHMLYLHDNDQLVYLVAQPDEDEYDEWGYGGAEDDEDEWQDDAAAHSDDDDIPELIDIENEQSPDLADAEKNVAIDSPLEAVPDDGGMPNPVDADNNPAIDLPVELAKDEVPAEPMTILKPVKAACKLERGPHFTMKGDHVPPGRGYYVCLDTPERIKSGLARFINEINVIESGGADDEEMAAFQTMLGMPAGMIPLGGGGFGIAVGGGPPPPGAVNPTAAALQAIAQMGVALGYNPPPHPPQFGGGQGGNAPSAGATAPPAAAAASQDPPAAPAAPDNAW